MAGTTVGKMNICSSHNQIFNFDLGSVLTNGKFLKICTTCDKMHFHNRKVFSRSAYLAYHRNEKVAEATGSIKLSKK